MFDLGIKYDLFSDDVIEEFSKIVKYKCLDEAINILSYLSDKSNKLVTKKDLQNIISKNHYSTAETIILTLECVCAIYYRKAATSYFYEISPVGIRILKNLIDKEIEKEVDGK